MSMMLAASLLRAGRGLGACACCALATLLTAAETNTPPRPPSANSRRELPPWPEPAVTLHVSPTANSAGTGAADKPFPTVERALTAVRELRGRGPIANGGVLILVHGGEYTVARSLQLAAADSGTASAPVRIGAAPGETPRFRGGVRLRGWQPVGEAAAYPLLPAGSRAKVWQLELKAAGVTNLLPLKLGGFASGNGFKTHPAHELFFNGKAMQLARGPNEGFLRIADVAVKDGTKGYDRTGSKTGKFFYAGDRPSGWAKEPDLLLYGYWFWDWADSYERVAAIDPAQRLVTLAQPWHTYGFSIGAPFYAVNALSELDQPGEWYLDRRNGRVLLYPPSDPAAAAIELSLFPAPMVELNDVSHVAFEGLTWELGSADAIRVRGGSNCLFAGCTIRRFAGNGIEIRGGRRHGLLSCDFYSLGRGGTVIAGGDRKTLTPGEHFLENCDIHKLSRIDHTYTPAVLLEGVGNHIAHNRFHDIPSSAMRVEGNEHLIEFNEVFNVVRESDDQGGADMFGNPTYRGNVFQFNYWHHIGNWQAKGDIPKCGQAGIRLDDAICGTLVYGNIFQRCSTGTQGFGAVQIHGGKENLIENNVFIDCAAAVSFTPWSAERWRQFVQGALVNPAVNHKLYLERYPELARLAENPNTNHIRRNLLLRCDALLRRGHPAVDAAGNTTLTGIEFDLKSVNPFRNRPGFDPIPVDQIGLYTDPWRRTVSPAQP